MSRGGPKITRTEYDSVVESSTRVDWLDQFANRLNSYSQDPKNAVEVARNRDSSYYDQITSIVSKQSPFASVEAKVQDLQERTGLKAFLQSKSSDNKKIAQEVKSLFPKSSQELNNKISNFIKNFIETHHGEINVPTVQHEISNIFKADGIQSQDINNPEIAKYISDVIIDVKKKNPVNDANTDDIGKGVGIMSVDDDGSNSDFFKSLLPAESA